MSTDVVARLKQMAGDPDRIWIRGGATYAELLAETGRLANFLGALGLRKGDRLLVQVEKCAAVLSLYLACLRAGVVFLPVNPGYTPSETAHFLGDAEPAVAVADPGRVAGLEGLGARVIALPDLLAQAMGQGADFPDPAHGPDDLAAILYTSGTTGRSKGVMLSRENLASNAETLVGLWRFTADDVLLHVLPVFHTHGLFVATNCVLYAGASMIFHRAFQPAAVLADLPQATVMMGVPTFYTRLLADPALTREACAGMRLFISGSAPLSPATHAEWQARTGHAILERYGMTETNMITSNPCDGARRAGTVGMPLPGVEVRITGPEGVLPTGEAGSIEVRGPNVFKGYWRLPDKTAEDFRDGWFVTGDLGAFDADGYLSILGRAKDLVITGGLNVYPAEVEAALDDLPGVAASAVIGVPHPDFGEAVVACVVAAPGAGLAEEAIRTALRDRLAGFKIPKRVLVLDDLPRNAMGKVQKAELRRSHAGLFQTG
ncbi:AMP-binding protein [Rhodobacter calidifons]|uniref:AMP-binding protein n=1 Tax=Rhodobacter calidifons TaxID=2715277 RepID=A0ABX0GBS5_9RHOB|nr:AMP-binding protein [Rhodobacter calidifons]NHB78424.1 AMP-binding protein [Rhodobacter calidifons]